MYLLARIAAVLSASSSDTPWASSSFLAASNIASLAPKSLPCARRSKKNAVLRHPFLFLPVYTSSRAWASIVSFCPVTPKDLSICAVLVGARNWLLNIDAQVSFVYRSKDASLLPATKYARILSCHAWLNTN